jgi:hypothetical protein
MVDLAYKLITLKTGVIIAMIVEKFITWIERFPVSRISRRDNGTSDIC